MEFFFGAFENEWEQRKAALLHERSLGRTRNLEEEYRRRRGTVLTASFASGGASGRAKLGQWSTRSTHGNAGGAGEPSMRSRFASLASGSQPAVVKMASFGGGGRLGAMIGYISRNGAVVVENERGEGLRGRDELSAVRREWGHLTKNRTESRDIATFVVEVNGTLGEGGDVYAQSLSLLKRGLGDRSFAYSVRPVREEADHRIEGVVVLRDSNGERLTADKKASEIVQGRLDGVDEDRGRKALFRFTGYGNGTEYGTGRLRELVERNGGIVRNECGEAIIDAKQAGDVVQHKWRDQLHSRKPRDVMHVIMSARAGTDVQGFHAAAREFLAQEFAGHRYVFSLHDPSQDPKAEELGGKRPHVHVHAIVAMRSDGGDRLETTIQSFRRWRVTMAQKARDHGIRMEMTDRRERASAPAHSRNQVRPTSRRGRTEHEGTTEAGGRRYQAKRSDEKSFAHSKRSVDYTNIAKENWRSVAASDEGSTSSSFALEQVNRLESALCLEKFATDFRSVDIKSRSQFVTYMVMLKAIVSEGEQMRHMSWSEFEAYEKRVETALFRAERAITNDDRANFDEIATAAREHVNVRRELMELQEQKGERAADDGSTVREREDDANGRWDEAVARHGLQAVEKTNEIMLEVEHYREVIALAGAGLINADKTSLQASLNRELARAGALGAAGNTLIREIAEVDHDLKAAIDAAERLRERGGKTTSEGGGALAIRASAAEKVYRDRDDEESRVRDERERDRQVVEGTQPSRDRPSPRSGDASGTDPAQQHIPRIEELQRETDEERERDDRER